MKKRKQFLAAADLFCGAGGTTIGAEQSGRVKVVLAVNHWRTAIYSHQANHPGTRHICARIDDIDPRNDASLPELDLLLASPECTHHSNARGGRPIDDQKRATPWHVLVWAEAKRPTWISVENVREFRDWGPIDAGGHPIKAHKGEIFRQWIKALEAIGYQVDHQLLNAADFGAPTKRTRLFVLARLGHSKRDIPWPEPTHAGRWRSAAEIIDWSRPCPSIFSRKRPLADKTLRRIEIGLRKFVGQAADPFIVRLRTNCDAASAADPLGTITAGAEHHALAVPYLVQYHNGPDGEQRTYDPQQPLPTLDTQPRYAVAMPFQFKAMGRNPGATLGVDRPAPTIVAARESHAVVVPYLVDVNHGDDAHSGSRTAPLSQPLGTVTTHRGQSLVLPFLTKYYGTGGAVGVDEPLGTITAKDRFGLAMASLLQTMGELHVVDIGFRMLDVDELARAQGFPEGYVLYGTKAEQIRQVGNAVCPPVAKAICETIAEAAA